MLSSGIYCLQLSVKYCVLISLIALPFASGCKKAVKDHYTSKIAGTWLAAGWGYENNIHSDIFSEIEITAISSDLIYSKPDTLKYVTTDKNAHTVTFAREEISYKNVSTQTLIYNYADNTLNVHIDHNGAYSSGYYGFGSDLIAPAYSSDLQLKDHINNVLGTKLMSGMVYDTSIAPVRRDTIYTISEQVTFTLVNEHTLSMDKSFLRNGGLLHFKSFDESSKTIVFQTYHTPADGSTTLTFNYATNSFTLEQRDYYNFPWHKAYMKLLS